ncbi:hypothetical protein P171DRAFT_484348 [Karstenula rhodostoma CBS 690.94]|uniref:Uncharacterized protein n=1 Tax=Karstenula rhodostoma CBS 690.94 TaxID=1392251 RepID=A0A9P4PK62_9PLEO|nr:hypothetical protein P171DRAFT_484348 [Karstenula rhodostoma CBS 690.94]
MGKVVVKDDAGGALGTEELLKLLEGISTPEVADGLGKDTVNRVDSAKETAGTGVGTPDGLDTVEDVPKGLTEDTGTSTEEAVDGTFGGPPEVTAGGGFGLLLDDTGGNIDAGTEAVIGALGCTLGGADEDAPGTDADEMSTELPGEPEPCGVFVMGLMYMVYHV